MFHMRAHCWTQKAGLTRSLAFPGFSQALGWPQFWTLARRCATYICPICVSAGQHSFFLDHGLEKHRHKWEWLHQMVNHKVLPQQLLVGPTGLVYALCMVYIPCYVCFCTALNDGQDMESSLAKGQELKPVQNHSLLLFIPMNCMFVPWNVHWAVCNCRIEPILDEIDPDVASGGSRPVGQVPKVFGADGGLHEQPQQQVDK